jgi:hypothetical protein
VRPVVALIPLRFVTERTVRINAAAAGNGDLLA